MMIISKVRRAIDQSFAWRAYSQQRYAILFYALLLTLILMPIATTLGLPGMLLKLLLATCLITAVMPQATSRSRGILLTAVLVLIFARAASDRHYLPLHPALLTALVGFSGLTAAAGALRFALTGRRVNREVIYAALSTYLLAGICFGQIYSSINAIAPGSLVGPDPLSNEAAIYYSFVTLATLGYGDFLPRSDIARGLATFEVIGGQLFLAVMVARLISAFGERAP